jgi:hypothetical protein
MERKLGGVEDPDLSPSWGLADRLAAARTDLDATARRLVEVRGHLAAVRDATEKGRTERKMLHDSAYARLEAQLAEQPVIEQAKGILMARSRCDADQALDMLRARSQRTGQPLRELAALIVAHAMRNREAPGPRPAAQLSGRPAGSGPTAR